MAQLTVISWRDIPSQVVVRHGRSTTKAMLSARFQEAIDRAAMRAGKTSSSAYLSDWKRSVPTVCEGLPEHAAQEQVARLEASYSDEDLLRLIRAHGRADGDCSS